MCELSIQVLQIEFGVRVSSGRKKYNSSISSSTGSFQHNGEEFECQQKMAKEINLELCFMTILCVACYMQVHECRTKIKLIIVAKINIIVSYNYTNFILPLSLYTVKMTKVYKQKVIVAGKVGMTQHMTIYITIPIRHIISIRGASRILIRRVLI